MVPLNMIHIKNLTFRDFLSGDYTTMNEVGNQRNTNLGCPTQILKNILEKNTQKHSVVMITGHVMANFQFTFCKFFPNDYSMSIWGFPCGSVVSTCQCRKHGFNPWVRKIPWRRKWHPTSVFLCGEIPWTEESGGLQSIGSQRIKT